MGNKVSRNGKGSFAAYKATGRFTKNKTLKLTRHLKLQPDDTQAAEALKKVATLKPRKEPARMKARIDSWVLPNEKGEFTGARTRNKMSGRLSPWGKFTQEGSSFSRANQNRLFNDPHRKLYLHQTTQSLNDVWSGWAEFEKNGGKVKREEIRHPGSHKNKNKKK